MSSRYFISPWTPRDWSRSSSSCSAATGPPPSRSPSTAAAGPPPTAGAPVGVSGAREGGTDSEDSGDNEDSVDTSVTSVEAVTSVGDSLDDGAELDTSTASADTTEAAEDESDAWEDPEVALEADTEPSGPGVTGDVIDASDPATEASREEEASGD